MKKDEDYLLLTRASCQRAQEAIALEIYDHIMNEFSKELKILGNCSYPCKINFKNL
ncbi:MAG: hypothetical protein HY559_02700 [Gammaproteobacteria bacterium]|nr:hypothetical protein [Gammaproteobacteria bacterium]